MTSPRQNGFFMPAEWTPHLRSWMMWPCRTEVWDDISETRANYVAVAHAIRQFEPLTMVVHPRDAKQAASLLGTDIDILEAPIDDSWCRDAGPCFLIDGQGSRAGATFEFNAWGGKYSPFDGDNAVAAAILKSENLKTFTSLLIAEGGGISVDGEGTILTTLSCFPNANRNPDWSVDQIETELKDMLGGEKVIWLPGNALETETDGHVDGIAIFVAPATVLMELAGPTDPEFRAISRANIAALQGQTDAKGRPITIHTIPDADSAECDDENFCRSYVNSYIVNGGVIMPSYGITEDGEARDIFQDLFPDREVVMVDIPSIAIGGGGIHCITQQDPAP